ncbi:hypothetical protein [Dyella sp. 2RAB6]|uniref:hypothetical protein n=1 Tax=Dyella sp. 2RAB6 TaxID=3232992 RepID=UPI003F91C78F
MNVRAANALRVKSAKRGIIHHAKECERALQCAAVADAEPLLGEAMANGLRKLAAYHSENAFSWARHLTGGAST